jgi:hypothetical protein
MLTIRFGDKRGLLNKRLYSYTLPQTVSKHLNFNITIDKRSWNQTGRSKPTWLKTYSLASGLKKTSTDT